VLLAALLPVACAPGSTEPARTPPRLVVLYAPCTVNREYLAPYAPDVTYTPHLAAFAEEAAVFHAHRTEAGLSGIAYASLFSGSQAPVHGVYTHPSAIAAHTYQVTEAFADHGWDPFYWNGQQMARRELGYGAGVPEEQVFLRGLDAGDDRLARVLERLRAEPDYRALLVTNFTVTHGVYELDRLESFLAAYPEEAGIHEELGPQGLTELYRVFVPNQHAFRYNFDAIVAELGWGPADVARLVAVKELVYKSRIHYLDELFGKLLARLEEAGLREESLVVFTADHGETLYREGAPFNWSHGHTLQRDVLTVPLLVRSAGIEPGPRDLVTRSMDVSPTLLGLCGIDARAVAGEVVSGADLSGALLGEAPAPELLAFSHSGMLPEPVAALPREKIATLLERYPEQTIHETWIAVQSGARVWKLRPRIGGRAGSVTSFDLERDPDEAVDVHAPGEPAQEEMAERLRTYREALRAAFARRGLDGPAEGGVDEEERARMLRSLGYIE
jgi:arylsulfatase A-like enzyme